MHSLSDWLLPVALVYSMLGGVLKGRAGLVGQFIFCWGAVAALAVYTWQIQRGRAEIDAHRDLGNPYTTSISAGHHQELWILLVGIAVLFLMPVVSYWLDRRRQRRTALSATTFREHSL